MSRLVLPQGSVPIGVLQGMLVAATGGQGTVQAEAVTWVTSKEHCTFVESQNILSWKESTGFIKSSSWSCAGHPEASLLLALPLTSQLFFGGHTAKVILQI